MRPLSWLLATVPAAFLAAGVSPASAQVGTDFASCAPDLAVCDANHEDCCVRAFDPIASDRAIVIPMDRCHQVVAQGGTLSPPTVAAAWCNEPGPYSSNDNGMFEAYGLVFRMMQQGIPIYWVINPTKEPPALTAAQNLGNQSYANRDVDTWIVSAGATPPSVATTALSNCNGACVPPVQRLNPATLAPSAGWSYGKREFPMRGGAFVIAAEDRARFNDLFLRRGAYAGFAGNDDYDFTDVDLYELSNGARFVYQDYRTSVPYTLGNGGNGAPVAVRIDYAPPRLARLAPAGVSETWLSMAKLNSPANYPACKTGAFTPADAVFCDVSKADIGNDALAAGGFDWAWIDNWNAPANPCSDPAEVAQVDKLRSFMTAQTGVRAGGHVVFMESVIDLLERCQDRQPLGTPGAVGLVADNNAPSEPLILRRAHNVFMQWGDLPTSFAQGAITRWRYHGGGANGYAPAHLDPTTGTLVRLVSEDRAAAGNGLCSRHRSTAACDVYARSDNADYYDVVSYLRFNDNPANGIAFYMGGNQITNGPSHLRMVLNTLISMPLATTPQLPEDDTSHEVARGAPIVGMFGGVETSFHGSFTLLDPAPVIPVYEDTSDDATFEFPYSKGHYRGTDVASGAVLFDAADHVPPANASGCGSWFSAACRTVFTNTSTGRTPDRVYLTTGVSSSLSSLLGAVGNPLTDDETKTLIRRILAGDKQDDGSWRSTLGGIDRSTAAVIEPSPLIPNQRPTMAYVGGLDGMLHAFCIDISGPCLAAGQELWAFIPRVMMSRLRLNDGRLDGSPKVADVFGDYNGDGRREWRTVLTFQLGSGQPGIAGFEPAVYALDISNPADPKILWEATPSATRGASELGVGVGLAMAPTQTATGLRNFTYVVSNNGGTGAAGLYVAALATETGEVTWTWSHSYPAARTPADPPVPASGIPGGAVVVDRNQNGNASEIAIPSLYGDLWLLSASTGINPHGASPLFRFGSDFHPLGASPTLYREGGRLHLVVGSGGYVDPVSTSWSPDDAHQYVVAVAVDPPAVPLSETSPAPDVPFLVDLGAGQRVYSQAVIAGGELYVTADRTDVNDSGYGLEADTGRLTRILLSSGAVRDTRTIHAGAASADASGGRAFTNDDVGVSTADYRGDFSAAGSPTEFSITSSTGAKLWLRIE